jgi:hypothetical protein
MYGKVKIETKTFPLVAPTMENTVETPTHFGILASVAQGLLGRPTPRKACAFCAHNVAGCNTVPPRASLLCNHWGSGRALIRLNI